MQYQGDVISLTNQLAQRTIDAQQTKILKITKDSTAEISVLKEKLDQEKKKPTGLDQSCNEKKQKMVSKNL